MPECHGGIATYRLSCDAPRSPYFQICTRMRYVPFYVASQSAVKHRTCRSGLTPPLSRTRLKTGRAGSRKRGTLTVVLFTTQPHPWTVSAALSGASRQLKTHRACYSAYVVIDVRGRGDSDGDFVPYRNDGRDGYDAIEWCATQPWSDGNIATMGGSYPGCIQWLAALEQPPHLRAMIVLVSPSDAFVEQPTGMESPMHLCWLHYVSGRVNQNMQAVDWMPVYEHLPLLTMDERAGRVIRHWRDDLAHAQLDDYWRTLSYQDKFDRIDVPVLHISGWYDDEQIGTPLNYAGMTANAPSEGTRRARSGCSWDRGRTRSTAPRSSAR